MSDRLTFASQITSEGRRLRGSVTLAGSRTFRDGELVEVDPKALMKADASNVRATIDHDLARTVGATSNNTLSLSRTEVGIDFETADLPNTTYANDALELAKGGYFGGSSFTVEGIRFKFSVDEETGLRVRTINSIKRLVDVAIVMDPAFTNSSAAAFSKETDVTEETEEQPKPVAQVIEKPKDGWAEFAKGLETSQIENAMDSLMESFGGKLSGEAVQQYDALAAEHGRRGRENAENEQRVKNLKALHDIRLGRTPKAPEAELFASDDYREAFTKYLRGKVGVMEQFAQSIAGDGSEGGYTVPDDFRNKIVETQAAFGGIQQHADVIETSDGRTLPYPTNNDTANSAAVATEGSAPSGGGADLVFGEISLGAFSVAATGASNAPLKVSWELLQDSAFDIESFVARKLGERLGRKAASLYANGAGSTEPFGLLAKTPDTMTATTMYAALVEHMLQVNEAYRTAGNCRWIMSDTILAKVFASLDDNGRPLFQPQAQAGGQSGMGGMLLGYPVQLDQAAVSNVAFGDIRQGFVIRRVRDVQVVVDPYNNTAARQNAYHAWIRTDSNIQDSAAVSVSAYTGVSADS